MKQNLIQFAEWMEKEQWQKFGDIWRTMKDVSKATVSNHPIRELTTEELVEFYLKSKQ